MPHTQIFERSNVCSSSWTSGLVLGASLALSLATSSLAASADPPLASPAIDESLFKDGAVQTRESKFEGWYTKCQEIVKVKRRICNLLSVIVDKNGNKAGSVLVATTDTGAPAMMLALTVPIRKDRPTVVESAYTTSDGKRTSNTKFKKSMIATRCDTSCKFIFPFDAKLALSLSMGGDITVTVPVTPSSDQAKAKGSKRYETSALVIRGNGFEAALKASSDAW